VEQTLLEWRGRGNALVTPRGWTCGSRLGYAWPAVFWRRAVGVTRR
jgi:hypothetical protein